MSTYRPLPSCLTIRLSEIDGLGLFAVCDLDADVELGITHVRDTAPFAENGYIRTPLGGFFNHSDNPNCKAMLVERDGRMVVVLRTLREIQAGEEITAYYWMYAI